MRYVIPTMGTVASMEAPAGAETVLGDIRSMLDDVEARFSLYRDDSELSRVASGELQLMNSSAELRRSYADALLWRNATRGAFTPNRPDGVVDLNGIVKAEAIAATGSILDAAGLPWWTVNIGGDLLTRGSDPRGFAWTIGIVDPADSTAQLCAITLDGTRRAVATSGTLERGDHLWLGSSAGSGDFVQVTVVADDIVAADVLATAIAAGGAEALDDATARWSVDVLTVDRVGALMATPGIRSALAA